MRTIVKGKKQKRKGKEIDKVKFSEQDKLLFKEIGFKGEGRDEEV